MNAAPRLLGRRIHIAGSVVKQPEADFGTGEHVQYARTFVEALVKALVRCGATFVVPVDAEKRRLADDLPICFDWLVWSTIHASLGERPAGGVLPLATAVMHHKNEDQIPTEFTSLWRDLRRSGLVQIESAAQWNMASKRMETQARRGEVLLVLGGSDGVQYLANLYHDAGKPVIPFNLPLCAPHQGARRLFEFGGTTSQSSRFFKTQDNSAHHWFHRINGPSTMPIAERVEGVLALLGGLQRPRAFGVRLLNPKHPEFQDVQRHFDLVVKPVVEEELGYELVVIDGRQPLEHARVDHEIFAKLHRSAVVMADITGLRPNCYIELGYALGRGLPTMLMAKDGTEHPFDISTFSGHHWTPTLGIEERKKAFREHWNAIRSRPSLVPMEPLIP